MRRLGIESLRRMDEVGLASEHLPGLRDRTGHAVNLAVWGDNGPVIVRWDYGSYALPITVRVGATMPMAIVLGGPGLPGPPARDGHRPGAAQRAGVRPAGRSCRPASSPGSRTEVLRDGYALTSGGVIPGVASVAAPVFTAGAPMPLVVGLVLPARETDRRRRRPGRRRAPAHDPRHVRRAGPRRPPGHPPRHPPPRRLTPNRDLRPDVVCRRSWCWCRAAPGRTTVGGPRQQRVNPRPGPGQP